MRWRMSEGFFRSRGGGLAGMCGACSGDDVVDAAGAGGGQGPQVAPWGAGMPTQHHHILH
jgi:hypothetical protein